jgi:hypothetical protein
MKLLWIISADFKLADQLLIRYSAFGNAGERMGVRWNITLFTYRFQESL